MTMPERLAQAQRTAQALAMLSLGYSPERVERVLEGTLPPTGGYTPLTDPTNVLMKEVGAMAHPRGPVDIMGVTTRTNSSESRRCVSCTDKIDKDVRYERVARLSQNIESYHVMCFEDEFGPRRLYGE